MMQMMDEHDPERPQGLPQRIIDSLGREKWTKECKTEECPVCQEDYSDGVEMVKLPCKHMFHPDCIIGWLRVPLLIRLMVHVPCVGIHY